MLVCIGCESMSDKRLLRKTSTCSLHFQQFAEPDGVLDLGHFASQILRYFASQLRILRLSDPTVLRIFDPLGGPDPPHLDLLNASRALPDPILGPSLAILGSTWPFQAHLEANLASKLLSSSLQAHKKTSKEPLCKLSEGSLPPEIGQKHCFSLGLLMFLTSQLWATLHPKIKPSKPELCLKMASWTPQAGPRRAQDSPRWG